jgi:hypothetical protein
MGDSIESTLLNQALGERKEDGTWKTAPNIPALIFISKTHPSMRERGYGEVHKMEHTGEGGDVIRLSWPTVPTIGGDDDD